MLVAERSGDDHDALGPATVLEKLAAKLAPHVDRLPLRRYPRRSLSMFSPAWVPEMTAKRAARERRDITHLHWVANGFLKVEHLRRLGGPLVWTLHDMWAFTGGCHYSEGCTKFESHCGTCPTLGSKTQRDLAYGVFERKLRAWATLDLTIVCPSRWMAQVVHSSALFRHRRIEVIPNCLDTEIFKPLDRHTARHALGLGREDTVLFFAATGGTQDRRKGFALLRDSLETLASRHPNLKLTLMIMGMGRPAAAEAFPYPIHYLGVLQDELSAALAYSAADAFVAPSIEENLPNSVMEAMSCGTPCVAFHIGGLADLIDHERTGYLAKPFDVHDFGEGILWTVRDTERRRMLSALARQFVLESFSPASIAQRHVALYEELLRAPGRGSAGKSHGESMLPAAHERVL
jgi:glycosyltransferase involved in cell wall biosynthesis